MQPDGARAQLGRTIKALRESQGWNQTELANRLATQMGKAVDPTTITRMERGTRPTTVDELFALGAVFSMEPNRLLEGPETVTQYAELRSLVLAIRGLQWDIAVAEQDLKDRVREAEELLKKAPRLEHELSEGERDTLLRARAPF